jgi:serine/threonine protein phosphatase PrpC
MITPEMARVHEGKTQLEFFLGAERLPKEPPIQQLTLQEGDLLLLCSDGVSGALTEEQIGELVRDETASLDEIADRLIQAALDAGETDNQTVILWRHTTGIESEGCAALDVAEAEGEQEDGGSDDLLDVAAPERPETDPPSSVSDEAPPANAGKKTWRLWGRRNQR